VATNGDAVSGGSAIVERDAPAGREPSVVVPGAVGPLAVEQPPSASAAPADISAQAAVRTGRLRTKAMQSTTILALAALRCPADAPVRRFDEHQTPFVTLAQGARRSPRSQIYTMHGHAASVSTALGGGLARACPPHLRDRPERRPFRFPSCRGDLRRHPLSTCPRHRSTAPGR
jgi:hypothetical protein